jgi:DNA-binding HxlR family transcriptional regulator
MVFMRTCPYIEAAFEVLGRKWNGRIAHYLATCENGSARFSEIERDIAGISPRALSLKLLELAGHGIIERQTSGESPSTVAYRLTAKGQALVTAMKPLQQWATDYHLVTDEDVN